MESSLRPFEKAGDGVWAVDADQRIILWNEAAEELLGHTAKESINQYCYELLAGRDPGCRPICRAHCVVSERAQRGKPIRAFSLQVQCADGRIAWIDVSVIVIPAALGSAKTYAALVHIFRLIDYANTSVPPLRIRLLGRVMVRRANGQPVGGAFQQRAKVRALFAYLALYRGQFARRDRILAIFWPHMGRKAALHNLNTTIYHLRHSLEPDLERGPDSAYIQARGDCYLLAGGRAHWLDVDAFENKLAAAGRVASPSRSERLYRQAIALYRGDFLADLDAYRLDCEAERERYRQLYVNALQELGDILLEQSREDEATDMYRKVLAADPCHEAAARKLMRLALQHGERTRALSQYARLEENLERELDVEPSQETRQLRQKARSEG